MPLYLARLVAFLIVAATMAAQATSFSSVAHLEWLVPLPSLNIALGHAVSEEPYRPAGPNS